MGSTYPGVTQTSETTIEITFTYRRIRCRERLKLKPTPANLKRAAQHRAAVLDAIEKGTFDYAVTFPDSARRLQFAERQGEVTTVEQYLTKWLVRRKEQLKASTWSGYSKIISAVNQQFGDVILSNLKRTDVRDWLETKNVSNKRLVNIQSALRAALQDAVMDELIETNPLAKWVYKRRDEIKHDDDVDPFTIEEQATILAQLTGQKRCLILFAFWTGLRTSELIALEWGDVDWRRGIVRVSRARTQAATKAEIPKTKSSLREVKLLPPALEALLEQKQHTYLANREIFLNPYTNAPWGGDQQIRQGIWIPALRRAGVRYRRPYQTRHTYASRMLTAGESPMWVAQQLGHADWGMIRSVYGKFIPDMQPDAGMKAVGMFSETKLRSEK